MSTHVLKSSPSEKSALEAKGYTILHQLGEGSYAKVFHAEYRGDEVPNGKKIELACKVIDTRTASKEFVNKFLPRELDIIVKLDHPNIVAVHSIFQRKGKIFIFMRFCEKGDLLDYVLKHGALTEEQTHVWMKQLVEAVQYLHDMEIAHRDLKCENVLITSNFNIKLADFGFVRYVVDVNGKHVTSATYCGSISYAAPEIFVGAPYHPKNADVWSLGIILYIMLNKSLPFNDTNVKRLHTKQVKRQWRFRSQYVDVLSPEVKLLVTEMLEPEATKRPTIAKVLNSEWMQRPM